MLKLAAPGQRVLAYGFWRYLADEVEQAQQMLALVRESGIDHIDTADVYGGESGFGGAERLLGALRKRTPSLFDGAVLATKAGVELGTPYNSSRDYLTAACDASLQRLGIERIDLFYVHRHDLMVHPADLAGTLDALVKAGKVAEVAVSNFTAPQIEALRAHLKAPLRAHQIEFSPAHVAPIFDGAMDQAMQLGLPVVAWSPMAGGRLGDTPAPEFAPVCAVLDRLAVQRGVARAAIILAFIQQHPAGVTPILGTKTPQRFREALQASAVTLTRREWYDILEARLGARMP